MVYGPCGGDHRTAQSSGQMEEQVCTYVPEGILVTLYFVIVFLRRELHTLEPSAKGSGAVLNLLLHYNASSRCRPKSYSPQVDNRAGAAEGLKASQPGPTKLANINSRQIPTISARDL
ncbi:hypothetical protein IFM46972_07738 [Aspergillus udagawae]|uniref:Uncharacterized protein n=1 Tax=Aspergillus udagawae TaxID=91492 RepID=A0A8H3S578_9EURO|nr:hypothetical protein IFM46972_07738 [Aspergillus udagawae]